MNKFKEEGHFC